jgi:putative zinc finger/helix-turn-helix YgiT family protein
VRKMKILKAEMKQCASCMEDHAVQIIEVEESGTFKGEKVNFVAVYEYCSNTEEYSETEEMMRINSLAQKDAYRSKVGLLTSGGIRAIREKYDIGQKDFAEVLGCGQATIARYETQQIQDRAYDNILRKIDADPKWFLEMLDQAKNKLRPKYAHYYKVALGLLSKKKSPYICSFSSPSYSFGSHNFSSVNVSTGVLSSHIYSTKMAGGIQYSASAPVVQQEFVCAA